MAGGTTGRLSLTLAFCAACATTEEKPDGPLIDSFHIDGTRQVKERDLKKKVLTTASFLPWLPFFGKEEHFDDNAWTADQRRVERYYQAHGFYQARVIDETVLETNPGHVGLRLEVREGQPTLVSRLDVRGLEVLDDKQRQTVLEKLPPKAGRVFLEEEWDKTHDLLAQRLQALGYAGATLRRQAEVDVDKHTAELLITADVGKRYKFGDVRIAPLDDRKVNPKLIEDQVTSVIHSGDWYSPDALEEAQARVFNMGVFSAVKVNRAALDQAKGAADIVVDVREAPFTTWRFGGGFGGDPLRNELRTSALYENRNFLGGTRRLTLRARLGYAALAGTSNSGFFAFASVFRRESGSQHGPFGRLTAEIEQPHFLTRALAIQLALEPSYVLEPAYRAAGASSRLSLIARPTSHLTMSFSYYFSIYQLSTPVRLASTATQTQFVGCGLTCIVEYFEQNVVWDHRDEILQPHRGVFLSLGLQEGGNTLAESSGFLFFNFIRLLPEGRAYLSFFDNAFTIAARARFGLMFTRTGTAPIPVRFFSGGNEMRGFSALRLSPYEVVPPTDCSGTALDAIIVQGGACPGQGTAVPVGGNTLIDGSLELRWNVWEKLTIATFVDAGYVTSGSFSAQIFTDLNVAVGIGVRYRTPIGPIRLDLAARLPFGAPLELQGRPLAHAVNRGCFLGLGAGASDVYPGSPEGQCAFHLSIGEAW
jgi:translocation and assembly module TamA